ncbi:hypothetical protein F7734_46905 [Scytonema sp. UIC 10036]|uniref:DUF6022 family protein n=1 Tax=Scytonema sp. UIC 10036 TaxID=2304196 RepID=UPI0012DA707B|nr:DUF6022 family protein [Scytonema sp. UIC 10036]MUG99422.1 hypothetical protein [Scytonema sp. UIC 10036]
MESLQEFLTKNNSDIFSLAQYIDNHIALNWEPLIRKNIDKLRNVFTKAGDTAYGMYLGWLFLPVHKQLKQALFRPEPRLPGDFSISREWGNQEETEQQRWIWSTIKSTEGKLLGTIVTIAFHDHTQFRIPQQPQIIALSETSKEAVVNALSQRSDDFKNALEFNIWYANYLVELNS